MLLSAQGLLHDGDILNFRSKLQVHYCAYGLGMADAATSWQGWQEELYCVLALSFAVLSACLPFNSITPAYWSGIGDVQSVSYQQRMVE